MPQWLATLACASLLWFQRDGVAPSTLAAAWRVAALLGTAMGLLQYYGWAWPFYPLVHPGHMGEAFANLRQRNQFATLTSIGLCAVIWADAAHAQSRSRWQDGGMLVLATTLGVGNAASSSRTGLLNLIVLTVLFAIWGGWRNPWKRRLMLVALASYAIALVVLPLLAGLDPSSYGAVARVVREDTVTCQSRRTLWANVLHLVSQHPWAGWGWGELDYAHFITPYEGVRFCELLDNAHNLPLQLAVELGVPAAALICGSAMWLLLRARPWRELDEQRQLLWAALAVLLVHSMLEYPLWYGPFFLTFVLCVVSLVLPARRHSSARSTRENIGLTDAGALVILMLTACASWDYWRISQIFAVPEERNAMYREQTIEKIRTTWLFKAQVDFAEYLLVPLTRDNASWTFETGRRLLHYSPEPRIVSKLIASARLLGKQEVARQYEELYRLAYPRQYTEDMNAANDKDESQGEFDVDKPRRTIPLSENTH